MILVLEITGLERHLFTKAMDIKNKKISKILDKYKSSFSSTDLSSLESLLSNDSVVNENYLLFTDGACEFDNEYKPINAGIGGVIKLKNKTLFSFSENVGVKTNNEAEYLALIKGVELCIKNNISNVLIFALGAFLKSLRLYMVCILLTAENCAASLRHLGVDA